jgi:hypothetical protein
LTRNRAAKALVQFSGLAIFQCPERVEGGHCAVRKVVPALQAQLPRLVEMMAERNLSMAHATIMR